MGTPRECCVERGIYDVVRVVALGTVGLVLLAPGIQQGERRPIRGDFGATVVGSVVGGMMAIILPFVIITSPFWLPLFSAAALVILAGVLVNKLLEKK